jgi:hypothetical protein
MLRPLILMIVVAPLVAIAVWPWLWHDTPTRLVKYIDFYLRHHPSLFYYRGTIYDVPFAPWHAPLVMTLLTTPVPILACGLVGLAVSSRRGFVRRREAAPDGEVRALDRLVLLNAACTIGAVCLPNVPKYGGVKLFLPFFPFLAILAAVGLDSALRLVLTPGWVRRGTRRMTPAIVLAVTVGTMGWELYRIHPYELSYYNFLVGGLRGADRHGFETQYYDLWFMELARWLDGTFPRGVRVFFAPNNKEYARQAPWYYATGRLHRNVEIVADARMADIVVLTHERRWPTYQGFRESLQRFKPLHELSVEGLPLLTVYEMPSPPEAATGGAGIR